VGEPGVAQPQHRQQDLIQGAVSKAGAVGLRQGMTGGHPGDERRVVAGSEPAGGEHVGHEDSGAPGHQREVGLVLDLLQAIHDQGGPRVPVDGKSPQFGQHAGVGRVPAVDRQLDRLARRVLAGELLDAPDLAGSPGDIPDRDVQVRDPRGDLRRRRQAQR
jgi:hypothetical protein